MRGRNSIDVLKELAIIVAIAVLTPLIIYHGSNLLVPYPKPSSYSYMYNMGSLDQVKQKIINKEYKSQKELKELKEKRKAILQYTTKLNSHQKTVFYVRLIAGLILILTGLCISTNIINTGLIFGGTISVIVGYFIYWDSLSDVLQFVSLLIALLLIILFSYFKLIRGKNTQ